MSDPIKIPRVERTPEQRAEERSIRELHRQNPIREVPSDTITLGDAYRMLKFVASIKREREAQSLTQSQLAELAKVDAAELVRLEAGHAFNPTVSTLFRIACALGKRFELSLGDPSDEEVVIRYSFDQAAKVAKENPY